MRNGFWMEMSVGDGHVRSVLMKAVKDGWKQEEGRDGCGREGSSL
jgi:hypothetical protein